jgi:MFS family permease
MAESAPPQPQASRLHPVVLATGWVSFLTDLGSEMIYPLLPTLITGKLGASKTTFGLIEGLAEGTPAVVRYFSGAWADLSRNRKWLVLAGYTLSSLAKPFIALAQAANVVLGLRVLDKIGKGIRTAPRDALIADYSEGAQGRAFGYQRAMDHAGAVGGGLASYALLQWAGLPLAAVIGLSVIPGLLTVVVIALFVHDRPDRVPRPRGTPDAPGNPTALGRTYGLYLVDATLFALANYSDAFLLLRATEMGMEVRYLPLAWSVLHVVKAVTTVAGGVLSDRIGRRPVLLFGWLLYAGVYASFASLTGLTAAWALFAVYGVFFGATEGVAKAFVADLIPKGSRGRAFGLLGMVEGLMLIPTSILTGWLWDATGSGHYPLLLNAAFALAAAAWLALFVRPQGAGAVQE